MSDWANFGGGGAADNNNKQASGKVGVRKEGRGLGNGCWRVYFFGTKACQAGIN